MKKIIILLFIILFTFQANHIAAGTECAVWNQTLSSAPFGARDEFASLVFNNAMWIIGGSAYGPQYNDVWSSTDGITWNCVNSAAAFGIRYGHSGAVYTNTTGPVPGVEKMWVIGGYNGSYLKDVWYSTDGSSWTQATADAAFGNRAEQTTVVFNGSMWVIAGGITGNELKNDVYSSGDGVNWTQVTSNAGFPARKLHSSLVYDNKIWVIGGNINSGLLNDVWYSSDGVTWNAATRNAQFTPRYELSSLVYDNKMWVIGGASGTTKNYDCWYSTDGITWTSQAVTAPFTVRAGHGCLNYDGKIWVMAGNTAAGYLNDVWWTEGQTPTPTPAATVVTVPAPQIICSAGGQAGTDWVVLTKNAEFGNIGDVPGVSYNGYMWIMFGATGGGYLRNIWKSADGITWSLVTATPAPVARSEAAALVFNERIYVTAGSTSGSYLNDVWYTMDGLNWVTATASAAFPVRDQHEMIAFQDKMWVIAGIPCNGCTNFYKDTWYSTNGTEWYAATRNAAFGGRASASVVVFNGGSGEKMWVIGGRTGTGGFLSDVWSSPDGITWTQETADGGFGARSLHISFVADNKIILAGGLTAGGFVKDAWSSSDGKNWVKICNDIGSGYAAGGGFVIHNNEFYSIGGGDNNEVIKTGCAYVPTATSTPSQYIQPTATSTEYVPPTATPTVTLTLTQAPEIPTDTPTPEPAVTEEPTPAITVVGDDTDVYPNPCKDHVKVVFNVNKKTEIKIYIYSFEGRLVDTVDYSTGYTPNEKLYQIRIDTSKYAPGMYFYVIQGRDEDGKLINYRSKKFMIKR